MGRAGYGIALIALFFNPCTVLAQVAGAMEPAGDYDAAIALAVTMFQASHFEPARQAFAAAHALRPSARTFRGLGLSLAALEQWPAARVALEAALRDERLPLPPEQRRETERLLARAVAETSRLTLRVKPAQAHVLIDDTEPVRDDGGALLLAPGTHALELTAAEHQSVRMTMSLQAGDDRSVEVTLPALVAQPPPAAVVAPATVPLAEVAANAGPSGRPDHTRSTLKTQKRARVLTWAAAAAVPVFGSLAATAWFSGLAKHDAVARACRADHCDAAEVTRRTDAVNLDTYATLASVGLALTAASAVTATVLFFTEVGDAPATEQRTVALAVSGSGVRLLGRF
jgi:hypothetical protein